MDASACAERIGQAMRGVSSSTTIEAQATADGQIVVVVTSRDERGAVEDIKEMVLSDLPRAATAAGEVRFDAFLAATASWLRGHPSLRDLWDIFLVELLEDPNLTNVGDYSAVLTDPPRRELYEARTELGDFVERHRLPPPDEQALRALFALTPAGRSRKGIAESVRAARSLASSDWGRTALVAMMGKWADEEYNPLDVAWSNGPGATSLLISGAWLLIDAHLPDGDLRRSALDAVDRQAQPVDVATLTRAGF